MGGCSRAPAQENTDKEEIILETQGTSSSRNTSFEGIGWSVRLQQTRTNYFMTLAKEVVIGNALKRGDAVYYYLVDCDGRKAILAFLDGKERPSANVIRLGRITFLING